MMSGVYRGGQGIIKAKTKQFFVKSIGKSINLHYFLLPASAGKYLLNTAAVKILTNI